MLLGMFIGFLMGYFWEVRVKQEVFSLYQILKKKLKD